MTAPPYGSAAARHAADALRNRVGAAEPRVAIVLGSGLGALVDDVRDRTCVAYRDVPGFGDVRVQGHAGELVTGVLAGVPVLVFAGRFHLYEGHSAQLAAFPVRVAHALGARTLLVSNAAGGVNPSLAPGDLMMIEDHLNLTGTSPLTGPQQETDVRFPDMSDAYDDGLRAILLGEGVRIDVPLQRGVYAGLLGPAYETRAEVRMLAALGADAVGMSTVAEVIVARALEMRVAGVSCIANMACGLQDEPPSHAAVLETTARIADRFRALVHAFVAAV